MFISVDIACWLQTLKIVHSLTLTHNTKKGRGDRVMNKITSYIIASMIVVILGVGSFLSAHTVYAQAGSSTENSPSCVPGVSIVKYTNGKIANNPNGTDVPLIGPGDPVIWTYQVTNTGELAVPAADVSVTDDQTGVTPVFDHEISGNGNDIFDPGEVWLYKADGTAVNLTFPPLGVKVVQGACTVNQTQPPRTAYVNLGTVTIPGASSTAQSSYCNPLVPAVSIVKYTNGLIANDPNGADVPSIRPGDPVVWTYDVTNIGEVSVPAADVAVTDDQTGVTPVFYNEISGNGDTVFNPGESWLYIATGTAVNLTVPPAGVKVVQGACTHNQTQPPRTAYVNLGTVTVPGATDTAHSSYCNPPLPAVSIVKYTNGEVASDPNGADVPLVNPGDPVVWTYRVTNTGNIAVPAASVSVTDDQTGVSPAFDHEIIGNGDAIFDPGEVWLYKATGTAVNLTAPPPGVIVLPEACTHNQTQPPRTAYVNQGTAAIPGASDTAHSSYCNPSEYTIFIPWAFGRPTIQSVDWHVAVGFEDLPLAGGYNDYDYNDWITNIDGVATFNVPADYGLQEITFNFTPQAHGAAYDHTFHMVIPHGTFGSNGTAVLTLFDQDRHVLTTQTSTFIASLDNDFVIFPKTKDVFPVLGNTVEGYPYYSPRRFASLDITFSNLVPFNISAYNFGAPHGAGLFFDPYLHVINTGEAIHRGDIRMLTVPTAAYLWPEETIRIDKAYPDITFITGNPPVITFPNYWWLHFNHCVYDGVTCSLLKASNKGPVILNTPTVTPP